MSKITNNGLTATLYAQGSYCYSITVGLHFKIRNNNRYVASMPTLWIFIAMSWCDAATSSVSRCAQAVRRASCKHVTTPSTTVNWNHRLKLAWDVGRFSADRLLQFGR